jgi:hypothetical protein
LAAGNKLALLVKVLMVKVRLLVSLYTRGPRKGDVCRDVALHKEMPKIPSRYRWNPHPPSLHP